MARTIAGEVARLGMLVAAGVLAAAGCGDDEVAPRADATADAAADAAAIDAAPDAPTDAVIDGPTGPGVAPDGTVPGELRLADSAHPLSLADAAVVVRVDATADQHVGFVLTFAAGGSAPVMTLERWDGAAVRALATTDTGAGVRALAAFDPSGPRTFWLRVRAPQPLAATLAITRTAFADGDACAADCAHLLQLPVRNDPAADGYDHEPTTLFAYQFGRRDLIVMVRAAGRRMAAAGRAAFVPRDLSQRDGLTPGTDVGAPRHASHQRGRDVDLSIYGADGAASWRAFCDTRPGGGGGLECVPGTLRDLDARATVHLYAGFLATGRVVAGFLDRELLEALVAAAPAAEADGLIAAPLVPLLSDGIHLQHAANQYHHLHVRVSESP